MENDSRVPKCFLGYFPTKNCQIYLKYTRVANVDRLIRKLISSKHSETQHYPFLLLTSVSGSANHSEFSNSLSLLELLGTYNPDPLNELMMH